MTRLNKDIPALIRALKKSYPKVECALTHKNPFQLLVATILSAQCTDERVNKVTPNLFKKYPNAKEFAKSAQVSLEQDIKSTGFYRNKAKSIRGTSKVIMDQYGGRVPNSMDELLKLPGVARKTANVVLGTAYGIAVGVVVDTHVLRLSARLGFTKETKPEKVEKDLISNVPQRDWIWLSHALITHGRRLCMARNPNCPGCPVRKLCANPVYS